jgi:hypothetical protein
MPDLIEWKDYVVIYHLGKHDRTPFRSWLKSNNKEQPNCPWEKEHANDCAYVEDYREFINWRRLQTP